MGNNTEKENMTAQQENAENGQAEKTFTQEEVNEIIKKRLAREKNGADDEYNHKLAAVEQKEQELDRREISIKAKELLSDKGLPKELADILRYDNEDDLVKAIDTLEHIRGFKDENKANAGGLPEGFHVYGDNRLPQSVAGGDFSDYIADAFRKG